MPGAGLSNLQDEFLQAFFAREDRFLLSGGAALVGFNGIRIDAPEEILANKLCVLLSRSEIRDLIDVMVLENAGFDLEEALDAAAKKDTGLTPGQLAWLLHSIEFGEDLVLPGNTSTTELRSYLDSLIDRLQKLALPG